MKVAREFYDEDSVRRAAYDGSDPTIRKRNEFIVSMLAAGDRCLDVGCGSGGFGPLLRTRFRFVTGVDLSLSLAREASARQVIAVNADLDDGELPYADTCVDAVTCCDVLEHVFDPVRFVRRVCRVIRPGGQFAVSVPNIRYWSRVRSLLLGGYFPRTTGDPNGYDGGHLHYFATRNLVEVLASGPFRDIQTFGFNADPSRRARLVSYSLRAPLLRGAAREFGCSTLIAIGRR